MEAAERRWERLRPTLVARARAMIGVRSYGSGAPSAEDLAQIVLLRLASQPDLGRLPPDDLRRYALTALHHAFLDECTRRRRELLAPDDAPGADPPDGAPGPEAAMIERTELLRRRDALRDALKELGDVERTFLRACLDSGSAPEAQRRCGWPPGGASAACERRNRIVARVRAAVLNATGAGATHGGGRA